VFFAPQEKIKAVIGAFSTKYPDGKEFWFSKGWQWKTWHSLMKLEFNRNCKCPALIVASSQCLRHVRWQSAAKEAHERHAQAEAQTARLNRNVADL
jgi:hypothetical protein